MRVLAALLPFFVLACAPKNGSEAAASPPSSTIKWADLTGAPFTLISLTNKSKEIQLPPARRPTMQFGEANRVSGLAGVNQYTTEAEVSGKDAISWIGQPILTKMAGPPEAMAVEENFIQALQAATRVELAGAKLTLASADGATRLELTRQK